MGWLRRVGFIGTGALVVYVSATGCATSGDAEGAPEGTESADAGGGGPSTSSSSSGGDPGSGDPGADSVDSGTLVDAGSDETDSGGAGNPVGFPCSTASDCASGECKDVLAGATGSVCVAPCTTQADCANNFFCDPATPGAAAGSCVPRSPAHCKTCSADAECGSLSEKCGVATGDAVKACHVDCTIGGSDACPPDYTCVDTKLDGVDAKVCRPQNGLSCLDALGGFCDRVATAQTCARANTAGNCVGQRTCSAQSNRFSACAAQAPVCKMTCSATDPAGCTTSYCTEATSAPANCGTCGTTCAGLNKPNAVVGCNQPTCTFACSGETYNVDNNKTNGCEVTDAITGNHSNDKAFFVGDRGCKDGTSNPDISGQIPSDTETHSPAIDGFNTATGSAPDHYRIFGKGSLTCTNNVVLTLTMSNTTHPTCYKLRVETTKGTYECQTGATGTCKINQTGGSKWGDDTNLFVIVSKTCSAASRDNPKYTVTGNL